ncbi:RNA-binding protein [Crocinitomicaceae bacterium]|nr:RNA-binding protein [Crocinitomicaceae bacterium]
MTNIFVAKLDFGVSDEALKSLFEEFGTVVKCHIAKDRETGKPRGFAFVEMGTAEEAQEAIRSLDDYEINGRNMVVKLAEDRSSGNKPRSSGPPAGRDSRPPRQDSSDSRPTKTDDFRAPIAPKDDDSSSSQSGDKTTKRGKGKKKKSGEKAADNREFKMSAYKKSGKKPRVEFEDDDDWELELLKQKRRGWTEDDDEM